MTITQVYDPSILLIKQNKVPYFFIWEMFTYNPHSYSYKSDCVLYFIPAVADEDVMTSF